MFRKQMQQLGRLVAAETQIFMLTATLPPSEEDELFRRLHFDTEQIEMFKAPTARTNVAYRTISFFSANFVGIQWKVHEFDEIGNYDCYAYATNFSSVFVTRPPQPFL